MAVGCTALRVPFAPGNTRPQRSRLFLVGDPLMLSCSSLQREVESDAWRAALARAEGAKVYDDPKQLRRTIKAETKAKVKRQDAWKERTERQQQGMVAKQQKCEASRDLRCCQPSI